MVVEEEFECLKIKMRFFNGGIIFIMLMISVLVVALLINSVEARRPSRSVRNMSWWRDIKPAKIKARFSYHKRPPNLLTPGVLHFRSPISQKYYFHKQGARIIKSSHFMKRYHLGRKISFVCVAKGHPRPNITWMKDGLELDAYAGYEHQISEWRLGKNKLKSKMEIDPAMPKDAGYYECQSDNKFSIDRRGFIAKYELN